MLASLTSKQVAEWIAFGTMEHIGADVPPDPDDIEKAKRKDEEAKRKVQRAKIEGGLEALANKRRE